VCTITGRRRGGRVRVITTWMYFDEEQIKGEFRSGHPDRGPRRGEKPEPGIGIGWFPGDTAELMTPIDNLKVFRKLRRARERDTPLSLETLRGYIDLFLLDADEYEFGDKERSLKNENVIDYVLSQPFVIERSPPLHMTLKGMITSTNLPIWIGTYMGWSVVPENSVLLFITVPGGIIIVSSAAGLANALSAGLSKSVKKLFKIR
jgi:hypothetical protein